MYGFLKKSKTALQETKNIQESYDISLLGDSLEMVLSKKSGRSTFRDFLKREFCEENLEFWLACREYRLHGSVEERTQIAANIYEEFIMDGSPKQVILDFYTRDTIRQSLKHPEPSCFSAAEKKIYLLMENSSFLRFIETEPYKLVINSVLEQRGLKKNRLAVRRKSPVEGLQREPFCFW